MLFEDIFSYNTGKYSFIIAFFNKYTKNERFLFTFSHCAQGVSSCIHEFAGIDLPSADYQEMRKGPRIWEGNAIYSLNECEVDFHDFAIIMLTAAKVFLNNIRENEVSEGVNLINDKYNCSYIQENLIKSIKEFRKNFFNIEWIKENCYGEGYVTDNCAEPTGEYHGKEWGEKWYETYGKYLNFDDIDDIVETQFKVYYKKK